jgi:carboxypeptidase Q
MRSGIGDRRPGIGGYRALLLGTLVVFAPAGSGVGRAQEDVLARIRQEGLDRSKVQSLFATLTDQFGPRLAGTPAYKQSAEWARDRMREFGLSDPRLEPFPFGRGWVLDRLVVEMVEPRYMPLIGYAEAWSAPMKSEIVATPVFLGGRAAAEVTAMKDRGLLKGAIVMTGPQTQFTREDRPQPTMSDSPVRIGQPPWVTPRPSQADTRAIAQAVREAGAAVTLKTSEGEHGTVFVLGRDQAENATPSVVLAGEHYNMIARMLERGLPVKIRVNVQSHFVTDDPNSYNVVAEIPGTDPQLKSEVVMIGAHLDSWHTGTGATDNADGVAVVLEAMRIIKTLGLQPKRTVRVGLWGAEEEGLLGSKAYAAKHLTGDANKDARDKLFVYLNMDPASGPIYGWYMQDSEPAKALFDKWLAPLQAHKELGVRRNVIAGIGNTDHLSFRAAGVPGFNPIQEYKDYDVRTHHTNADLYERVREQDLKQNAVVMAWFAWQAATTAERIPRP